MQDPILSVVRTQNRATASASAAATALGEGIKAVRLQATQDCYVKFGGTAAAGDLLVMAGHPVVVAAKKGDVIHAIRISADGILNIAELG